VQLAQLLLQPLTQAALHKGAELVHQIAIGPPEGAAALAGAAHQAGALQLAELAADRRLGKPGGLDQRAHIQGPLAQQTQQLQAGWLTEQMGPSPVPAGSAPPAGVWVESGNAP